MLEAVAQDQSGLRCQVNIALGGTPEPLSGASALITIRVAFAYDLRYCYCNTVPVTFGIPGWATSKLPNVKWDSRQKLPVLFGT